MSALAATHRRIVLTGAGLAVFLSVAHTVINALTSMLSALLPTIQIRFRVSESVLALLIATLTVSASITQPLFGALADRFDRRSVGAMGVVLSTPLLDLIGSFPRSLSCLACSSLEVSVQPPSIRLP